MTGSSSGKLLSVNLGKGATHAFRSVSLRVPPPQKPLHKVNIPAGGVRAVRAVLRLYSIPVKRSKVSLEPTHKWITWERQSELWKDKVSSDSARTTREFQTQSISLHSFNRLNAESTRKRGIAEHRREGNGWRQQDRRPVEDGFRAV